MPQNSPQISVIIVSYNTAKLLEGCLNSLRRISNEVPFEVIVTDNCSTDNSTEMVAEKFPEVKLIKAPRNGGFSYGNNLGIAAAAAPCLFFLNPDTLVPPTSMTKLLDFLKEHEEVAAVGAGLTDPYGDDQPSSFKSPSLFREFWNLLPELKSLLRLTALSRLRVSKFPHEVESVSGAAFMAKSDDIKKIGGFDDKFFLYHEELDLCLRLGKLSKKIYSLPKAQVIHFDSQASGYQVEKLAQSPVLDWRLNSMDRIWFKHKSSLSHKLWRMQTRNLLFIRIFFLFLRKITASSKKNGYYAKRLADLARVRQTLKAPIERNS